MITETQARKVIELVDAGLVSGLGQPKPGEMCVEAAVCYALGLPHGDDPKCVSPALRQLKMRLNDSRWSSNAARAKGMRKLAVAQLGSLGVLDDVEFAKRVSVVAIQKMVPIAFRATAKVVNEPHKSALLNWADVLEREPTLENCHEARKAADASASAYAYAYAYASADASAYAYASADASAYASASAYAYASADVSADASADVSADVYADTDASADVSADVYADTDASAYASAKRDEVLTIFADEVLNILVDMKAPGCAWLHLCE